MVGEIIQRCAFWRALRQITPILICSSLTFNFWHAWKGGLDITSYILILKLMFWCLPSALTWWPFQYFESLTITQRQIVNIWAIYDTLEILVIFPIPSISIILVEALWCIFSLQNVQGFNAWWWWWHERWGNMGDTSCKSFILRIVWSFQFPYSTKLVYISIMNARTPFLALFSYLWEALNLHVNLTIGVAYIFLSIKQFVWTYFS